MTATEIMDEARNSLIESIASAIKSVHIKKHKDFEDEDEAYSVPTDGWEDEVEVTYKKKVRVVECIYRDSEDCITITFADGGKADGEELETEDLEYIARMFDKLTFNL